MSLRVVGVRAGKLAQVYGAYVWANFALTAALAVVLWRQKQAAGQALRGEGTAFWRLVRYRTVAGPGRS